MSFSYDPTHAGLLDQVRFAIGDTDPRKPQLQDEEITALLAVYDDSPRLTALAAVDALIARYARETDKWVGDLKILASQRQEQYAKLRERLEEGAGSSVVFGVPSAGGIYVAEKASARANTLLVQPAFRIGMHDNE